MKIELEIAEATVVRDTGPDHVILVVGDRPSPYAPGVEPDNRLRVRFEALAGHGVDYVREHFGIEPELIDVKALAGERKTS